MKKFILSLILFLAPLNIYANELIPVKLDKCIDGDTAWFLLNNERIKARFLAIDTPESINKIDAYGKEASIFTCNYLTNSTKIEIEYDENSNKLDKYNRHLVWVFVDGELLQDLIVKNGFADIKYIYGKYKYLDILNISLNESKKKQLNIWNPSDYLFKIFDYKITTDLLLTTISLFILIILSFSNKKIRKKIKRIILKHF